MQYTMVIADGCIIGVGRTPGVGNCSKAQYDEVIASLAEKPLPRDGFGMRLRTDLTWEEYELPPAPAPSDDDELSDEEAYNIIMGVSE